MALTPTPKIRSRKLGAAIELAAVPFVVKSRREGSPADTAVSLSEATPVPPSADEPPVTA